MEFKSKEYILENYMGIGKEIMNEKIKMKVIMQKLQFLLIEVKGSEKRKNRDEQTIHKNM